MTNKTLHGIVTGRTIQLTEDPGVPLGQEVELVITAVAQHQRPWGEGLRKCAGAMADHWTEEDDRILQEIYEQRKSSAASPRSRMSHLLDTNVCSAHLKRPSGLIHRFIQHAGRLFVPAPVVGELYTWANHRVSPSALIDRIENDLLNDVQILEFDKNCAIEFGRLNGRLLLNGITVNPVDLMIAATARVHDLTLVTHNVRDFQPIPGLRLEDWLEP